MQELILACSSFILGIVASLMLFKHGIAYATRLIYRIKADVPLEEIGIPMDQDGTE